MPTSTVTALVARAREVTDMETATPAADFITDTEITKYLNQGHKALVDLIIEHGGSDQLALTASVAQAGVAALTPYRILGVDRLVSGVEYVPYPRWRFEERTRHTNAQIPAWRWVNQTLTWLPSAPTSTFRLWYIATPGELDDGADTVSNFNGWDDFLVAWAAIRMLQKAERDTSEQRDNLLEARGRIVAAVAANAPQSPDCIADVQVYPEDFFSWWH